MVARECFNTIVLFYLFIYFTSDSKSCVQSLVEISPGIQELFWNMHAHIMSSLIFKEVDFTEINIDSVTMHILEFHIYLLTGSFNCLFIYIWDY